jgi:hypothetical protein
VCVRERESERVCERERALASAPWLQRAGAR